MGRETDVILHAWKESMKEPCDCKMPPIKVVADISISMGENSKLISKQKEGNI